MMKNNTKLNDMICLFNNNWVTHYSSEAQGKGQAVAEQLQV